ncbi:TolC family protein [uncultured Nitrospira sp.]|uniref:TolC family protein n=1 Tax=uncultured Nitrospira sp. TaxID=157176 RepID=UPI003140B4EF
MNNKLYSNLVVFVIVVTFSGCTGLKTDLAIPENEIPTTFKDKTDTTNIADIQWRDYFVDPLLHKLIDTAIENNLDLQMALQRIENSRSSVRAATGALMPTMGLGVGTAIRRYGDYTMDGAGNATTDFKSGQTIPANLPDLFVGLQSSWEVDIWGKLQNQRSSAISKFLASIEGTSFVVSNLVADVAIYYNELRALDNELDIIRQTLHTQYESLEVVELQKEAGRATELAVELFKAQVLNTSILEKEVLQQIVVTENHINFLLGRFPQPIERTKGQYFTEILHEISSGVPSQLLANRPDVREAEFQIKASKFDLKVAKASFFPSFNITASFGFQAFNPDFLFVAPSSIAYTAVGTLVAPLINRNALHAQFNNAEANQLTAMYQYQKTILNAYVEVANELSNIHNLRKINTLKKQQNEVLQQSVETSHLLYRYGRASYLEVLIAQRNALQSNLELINFAKQLRIAAVKIYKALGGGWK